MTKTPVLPWMLLVIAVMIRYSGRTAATATCVDVFTQTLMDQLNAMMDEVWPDIAKTLSRGHYEPAEDAMAAIAARPRSGSARNRLIDGFFYRKNRPVDADAGKKTKTTTESKTAVAATATTTIGTDRIVFGTEHECVSAATADGQWQRRCVCFTIEYLDVIGQRLDVVMDGDGMPDAGLFECTYYKAMPVVLVVRADTAAAPGGGVDVDDDDDDDKMTTASSRGDVETMGADQIVSVGPKEVDFYVVADYQLQTTSENDHYHVHYGFVGTDVIIRCLAGDEITEAITWKYESRKHKSMSMIVGADRNELSILNLEPADSKNYTCSTEADSAKNEQNKHYVIAVEKPIYEIRGTATYMTSDNGVCTREMIGPLRKQLSAFVRNQVCPEGLSRYMCKVSVEKAGCSEEGRTLEIEYSVTLNELSEFLAKLRTNRIGRNVLYYQQVVARIFNVFTVNLDKALAVQIVSRFSPVDVRFTPDYERTTIKTVVSCAPGFGIREVFCAACPTHHYGPANSAECFKCPSGFHQPFAGSEKCIKCPYIFSSGCYTNEIWKTMFNWLLEVPIIFIVIFIVAVVCCCSFVVFLCSLYCCHSEDSKKRVKKVLKIMKRKSKNRNSSTLLPSYHKKSNTKDSTKKVKTQVKSIGKSLKKLIGKPVHKIMIPKIPFKNVHEMFSPFKKSEVPDTHNEDAKTYFHNN